MGKSTQKIITRVVGGIYGLFGITILGLIFFVIGSTHWPQLSNFEFWIFVSGAFCRSLLFLAVAWLSWKHTKLAAICAWVALAIFVGGALLQSFLEHGIKFFDQMIASFYFLLVLQIVGAVVLSLPARKDIRPITVTRTR